MLRSILYHVQDCKSCIKTQLFFMILENQVIPEKNCIVRHHEARRYILFLDDFENHNISLSYDTCFIINILFLDDETTNLWNLSWIFSRCMFVCALISFPFSNSLNDNIKHKQIKIRILFGWFPLCAHGRGNGMPCCSCTS